jgi:porin
MLALRLVLVLVAQSPEDADAGVVVEDAGVAEVADEKPEAPTPWVEGEHFTGEWGGARTWLASHGVTFDLAYAGEIFANAAQQAPGDNGGPTGHLDFAVTFDFEQMGLWPGGKFYVLGQNNHGRGINEYVGSSTEISNIEATPYTQLGEFFYEQSFAGIVRVRLGKQDANREFGTPRFGGNFINNNFGMLPSSPLPSYPTNGLGAVVVVQPIWWLVLKASFFEGQPQIGSYGFDSALVKDAGHFVIASVNGIHHFGAKDRSTGTTTVGFFRQQGLIDEVADVPMPRTFKENYGAFFQNDERIYLNPGDDEDPRSVTFISRVGWSQPDRNNIGLFVGASVAYHGLGSRRDDTIGIGFGWFTVARQANGTPGPGTEFYMEAFYKWRMTRFMSLQPDLQYYRTPGGDGQDALLVGARIKFKL